MNKTMKAFILLAVIAGLSVSCSNYDATELCSTPTYEVGFDFGYREIPLTKGSDAIVVSVYAVNTESGKAAFISDANGKRFELEAGTYHLYARYNPNDESIVKCDGTKVIYYGGTITELMAYDTIITVERNTSVKMELRRIFGKVTVHVGDDNVASDVVYIKLGTYGMMSYDFAGQKNFYCDYYNSETMSKSEGWCYDYTTYFIYGYDEVDVYYQYKSDAWSPSQTIRIENVKVNTEYRVNTTFGDMTKTATTMSFTLSDAPWETVEINK